MFRLAECRDFGGAVLGRLANRRRALEGPVDIAKRSVVSVYRRLLRAGLSQNEILHLHSRFESSLTPEERSSLILEGPSLISDVSLRLGDAAPTSHWLKTLERNRARHPSSSSFIYQRAVRNPRYLYYRGGPGPSRGLVVGFGGNAGRLMMPSADFLTFLGAHRRDLLLIRPQKPDLYRLELPGFGSPLKQGISNLRSFIQFNKYTRVDTMGTSSGALPAIYAGPLLGARTVSAIGVGNANKPGGSVSLDQILDVWNEPVRRRLLGRSRPLPRLTVTIGEADESDRRNLETLARELAMNSVIVPGAKHLSLWPMVLEGAFESWLDYCLTPSPWTRRPLDRALSRMKTPSEH